MDGKYATLGDTRVHCEGGDREPSVETVVEKLARIVRDGIAHGHFEFKIAGRDASGGRTEVTIAAGKVHRFLLRKK